MKDNRFNFRMDDLLRQELEILAKPSNMKIATLMKAILWKHINDRKKPEVATPKQKPIQSPILQQQKQSPLNGNHAKFLEYMKQKNDPDMQQDDWEKVVLEIEVDSELNDFQRSKLLRPIGR